MNLTQNFLNSATIRRPLETSAEDNIMDPVSRLLKIHDPIGIVLQASKSAPGNLKMRELELFRMFAALRLTLPPYFARPFQF